MRRTTVGVAVGIALLALGLVSTGSTQAQEFGGSSYPGPYFMGAPDAPVTIDAYEDFQCTNCEQFHRTVLPRLLESYIGNGQVKMVWHDFTWLGDESRTAAQAARCAGQEGLFWGYNDWLYTHQRGINLGQFSRSNLTSFAGDLGLNTDAFSACLDAGADAQSIRDDYDAGRALGIVATPVFIVNGERRIVGVQSFNYFTEVINAVLTNASQ